MVLYFGCRRSDQDYLYGDVLEAWAKDGSINLFTAFSRQQVQAGSWFGGWLERGLGKREGKQKKSQCGEEEEGCTHRSS